MRSNIEDPEISCKGILTPSKMFIFSFVYDFFFRDVSKRRVRIRAREIERGMMWCLLVVRIREKKGFCILHNVLSPFFLTGFRALPFFITIMYVNINFKPIIFDTFSASLDLIPDSYNLPHVHKHKL